MKALPPPAPKRRAGNDTLYAWGEGLAIGLFAIVAHRWFNLGEHAMSGLLLLAGQRLPRGRFADGKRWDLARKTRTEEQAAVQREEDQADATD
jgi:hypothetical protein